MLKFSKLFGSKKRSIRKASALVPVVAERLEARVVPAAGIVTAKIVGTSLTLTGDNSSNEVTVTVNDDGIFVEGQNGTKVKFGTAAATADEVKVSSSTTVTGNVTVDLKGGNDIITLVDNSGDGLTVNGNVTVNLGDGNDIAALDASGNDGTLTISKTLTINGGAGKDCIALTSIGAGDAPDRDAIAALFDGTGDNPNIASKIQVGAVLITGGNVAGNDLIVLAGVDVDGNLTIQSGTESNVIDDDNIFAASVSVGGNLSVTTGNSVDVVSVVDLVVDGNTSINTGNGWDFVLVNFAEFGGTVNVNLGKGDDSLIVGEIDADPAKVTVSGGASGDNNNRLTSGTDLDGVKLTRVNVVDSIDDLVRSYDAIIDRLFDGVATSTVGLGKLFTEQG